MKNISHELSNEIWINLMTPVSGTPTFDMIDDKLRMLLIWRLP